MAEALKQTLSDIGSGTGQPKLRTIGASLLLRGQRRDIRAIGEDDGKLHIGAPGDGHRQ